MSLRDFLDANEATHSYFLNKYDGTTRFQVQTLEVNTDSDTRFGGTSWTVLPHRGDVISRIILKVEFEETDLSFIQSAGTYMIDHIELYCGRQLIERVYGEYIELLNDLTVPEGKQPSLGTIHGKGVFARSPLSFYVVVPFSLIKRGLPLAALKEDTVIQIKIQYKDGFTFAAQANDAGNFILPYERRAPINQKFLVDYVYLSDDEAKLLQTLSLIHI